MAAKLEQFFIEKGSSEGTKKHYTHSVKLYEKLNQLTLDELINEADLEEEQSIRWKNRQIKERLIQFRNYLYLHKAESTSKTYMSDIKTLYRHYEIELQKLPSFNSKQVDKTYEWEYEDILKKSELIDAYYEATNVVKCILLLSISSGLSKVDLLELTVDDFIKSCDKYYTTRDATLKQLLYQLRDNDCVIPCFKGNRKKTGIKYTTFCSPEASEHIIQYLIGRDAQIRAEYQELLRNAEDEKKRETALKKLNDAPEKLEMHHQLFDISLSHLSYVLRKINNKLEMGRVGKYSKLRCHAFRKFHASTLANCDEKTWTVEEIDALQGRALDKTHRAYFTNSVEKLYNKYVESVDELMLFKSIHEISKEDFEKLEKENRFYQKEIVKNESKLEEQQRTIDEIISNQRELEKMLGL